MKTQTKFLARMALLVVLVTSVLNLPSCNINWPWIQRGWSDASSHFDTFKDTEKYIRENSFMDGYTFLLFDLDNEKSVEKTFYEIQALDTVKNGRYVYSCDCVVGTFYATKDTNESQFRINYKFRVGGIDVSDNAKFEIRLLDNVRDVESLLEIYNNRLPVQINTCGIPFGLWADDQIIMEILFSEPLLEDVNYDEYYIDACKYYINVCEMLLKNLVVIK